MANESPAFQFYPRDFVSDPAVQPMTAEQVGAYWLMLCAAWHSERPGYLPNDPELLAAMGRLNAKQWAKSGKAIMRALKVTDDGQWVYSKRMVEEWQKQTAYKASQSDAGKRGAAKRWGAHSDPIASASRPHDGANGGAIATTMANDSSASASASAEEISLSRAGARVERPSDMEMLAAWEAVDLPGSPLLTNVAAEIARTPKNQRPTPMAACEAYKAWVDAMHATRRFPRVSPENMLTNWSYVVDIARGAVKPKDIARGATATSEPGVGTEPTRRDAASRPSETVGYRDDD